MPQDVLTGIRLLIHQLLEERGSPARLNDDESLFFGGHLDSMAAIEVITWLEAEYRIDFSRIDFDVALIDSITEIRALVQKHETV
jgi:acyl carrier protein